jgi:Flp pilus assembly protein TadG
MSFHARRRNERGAEAVEFALIAIPMLLLVLGIIQYGFYFWTAETTNSSARETARRVIVGDCWDNTQMTNYARNHAPQTSSVSRSADPATLQVGDSIQITVTANANLLGLIPLPDGGTITRVYVARMESTTNSAACPGA